MSSTACNQALNSDARQRSQPLARRWVLAIVAAAGLAFAIKVALALNTYGSTDSLIWDAHLAKIKAQGVLAWYRDGVILLAADGHVAGTIEPNHPPLMTYALVAWDHLSRVTGLPLRFWLRLTSSLADVASVLLLLTMFYRRGSVLSARALLLIALSPVSIMVSGFHVNTDPVMLIFLLLSIYTVDRRMPSWATGLAFGLAMSVKVVPIIFAPAFLFYMSGMRRRIEFMLCAGAVFILGSMPYLLQDPVLVIRRTFGYTPHGEYWGLTQMIYIFLPSVFKISAAAGKPLVFLIVLLVSFQMNKSDRKTDLFLQCGLVACLFLFFAPGFGYQYLAWLVPWSAGVLARGVPFYYAASTAFLFSVYTVWSRGLPWFFANTLDRHLPLRSVVLMFILGAACWISIGAVAWGLSRSFLLSKDLSKGPQI